MKKNIIKIAAVLILLITTAVNAQDFQGKAYYQTKQTFKVKADTTKVETEMQKQIREMIHKQYERTFILTFNKAESIYEQEEQLEKPKPTSGFQITVDGLKSKNPLYKNTQTNQFTHSKEAYGKRFLIEDDLETIKWNSTKETKMIGKYLCIKATAVTLVDDFYKEDNKKEKQKELKITAWYTPEIPVSTGPELFNGLPGLILELHKDKMHYVCNKIILNPKEKTEIVAPKKGEKVTQKEFDKMNQKKQKEMREMFKGGRKKGNKSRVIMIGG